MAFVYKIKAQTNVDMDVCIYRHISVSALVFCDCSKKLSFKTAQVYFLRVLEATSSVRLSVCQLDGISSVDSRR